MSSLRPCLPEKGTTREKKLQVPSTKMAINAYVRGPCVLSVRLFPSNAYIVVSPWLESARELYRPGDIGLSAKLVPTFADRWVSHGQCGGSPTAHTQSPKINFLISSYLTALTSQILCLCLQIYEQESSSSRVKPCMSGVISAKAT
jgi:hypothetical protein